MQVWERQKEQVPKKNAIEKCNSERNKNEKWRKCKKKITPETNWTNMISEKLQKARKKQKKLQVRPGTNQTNMILEKKLQKPGEMHEKCEKMRIAFLHLHFSCICDMHVFLHCVLYVHFFFAFLIRFFCSTWCIFQDCSVLE